MRRTALLAGFSAATLLTGMTLATAAGNPTGAKGTGSNPCDSADFTLEWTPAQVFPPNHKYVPVTLTYATTTDDDLTLQITGVTHDEFIDDVTEMNGAGNTPIDWEITEPTQATGNGAITRKLNIRAERSGRGDGRTYSISYTAKAYEETAPVVGGVVQTDDCSGTATVVVPHDMGQGNDGKV